VENSDLFLVCLPVFVFDAVDTTLLFNACEWIHFSHVGR